MSCWTQASNNTGILNTCTRLWLTESEQATPVDSIKDVVRCSVKVPEFEKHLKKAGGHIGWNVVEITIKIKTIVRKPLMIKINKSYIYIYIREYTYIFTCVRRHAHAHTHTHTYISTYTCLYIQIFIFFHIKSYIRIHFFFFWRCVERAAAGIGLHVNAHKTENMCFNWTGVISTLGGSSLKLVDKFTYLRSSVSSSEKDIDTRLAKAWTDINRLSVIWKSDLTDKMKRSFFQAAVVSILLYGYTTWTLTKRMEKRFHGN